MLKKMISRIILSVVMMFTILFQGAGLNVYAAGTPREVTARITSFKIFDRNKQEGVPIWFTDYFYLSMDWDASGNGTNLKEGDYFDITLPDKMKFPEKTTKRDFGIIGPDGTTVMQKHMLYQVRMILVVRYALHLRIGLKEEKMLRVIFSLRLNSNILVNNMIKITHMTSL